MFFLNDATMGLVPRTHLGRTPRCGTSGALSGFHGSSWAGTGGGPSFQAALVHWELAVAPLGAPCRRWDQDHWPHTPLQGRVQVQVQVRVQDQHQRGWKAPGAPHWLVVEAVCLGREAV